MKITLSKSQWELMRKASTDKWTPVENIIDSFCKSYGLNKINSKVNEAEISLEYSKNGDYTKTPEKLMEEFSNTIHWEALGRILTLKDEDSKISKMGIDPLSFLDNSELMNMANKKVFPEWYMPKVLQKTRNIFTSKNTKKITLSKSQWELMRKAEIDLDTDVYMHGLKFDIEQIDSQMDTVLEKIEDTKKSSMWMDSLEGSAKTLKRLISDLKLRNEEYGPNLKSK